MDSALLAQSLATRAFLPEGLVHDSCARRNLPRFYQFATRWTTLFFKSNILPLEWIRDSVFPIIQRIPPWHHQMTAMMAGGKTGRFEFE